MSSRTNSMVRPSFSIVIPLLLVVITSNSVIEIGSNQSQITMTQQQQVTKVT
ncbi:MAG: hypothetical protein QN716_09300 [Nitrososphaeraceae archaeon]|jgi:hypothetical protein|nr:hypothetical protein [Nitrososphaeraceae archaeon]